MRLLNCLLLLIATVPTLAQTPLAVLPSDLRTRPWPARWVTVPGASANGYGVYHFRKRLNLISSLARFVVHVSADNRYKLYVNGQLVSLGPARSDLDHWNFETVDLGPYLRAGPNVLAAVVWQYGELRPYAEPSYRTGFLMQGNGPAERMADTDPTWKCRSTEAYAPLQTDLKTYFAVGPGEDLDGTRYPWGWEQPGFDDADWFAAQPLKPGTMWNKTIGFDGWTLTPRPLPALELRPERLARVRRSEGIAVPADFPEQPIPLTIPPQTRVTLLLDQSHLTTAYPQLTVSGGRGAVLTLAYAESLFESPAAGEDVPRRKGHRDSVENKVFFGYRDRFRPDGGRSRTFSTLWWRTYRYLELSIETDTQPLVLDDLHGLFTAYPFRQTSQFAAPDRPDLERLLGVGWRTARLCAHETYEDCPYYEQMQYAGDVRIQALVSLFNTDDDRLARNAIVHLRNSLSANALTMSRYPSREPQYIPTFSLWWLGMVHDYWRYRGDTAFVRTMLPATRLVLTYFSEKQRPSDGLLERFPNWPFTDWTTSEAWETWHSVAPYTPDGESAPLDLQLLLAYQAAAQLETEAGMPAYGERYAAEIVRLKKAIRRQYWDERRGLFADTPQRRQFSQHANLLAVLTGVVEGDESKRLMEKVLADSSLVQTSIFFKYYLHQAVAKAGLGDRYLDLLGEWRGQLERGLTTWAETHEPSRSDCHAWGASPNVELFRLVLGVDSDAPGFRRVLVQPHLGTIPRVSGRIPHPAGGIDVAYERDGGGRLKAVITLPEGITGRFRWQGKEWPLRSGRQILNP